ncbi:phage tail protein I [Neisseria lactamica]|uniref:phage tail protein I n=1 Tax=Neisseria lactamica TaxID=486 RepID=UPI000E58CD85|nr:phage tail protein I [Neisseria lactamica]
MNSTIPSNNSPLQHALAHLTDGETAALDTAAVNRQLDPARCDPAFLPFLAWQRSIETPEGWELAQTDEARRRLIAAFDEIHAHKGTPHAIRQLFRLLQLGEVQIIERANEFTWNGEVLFDGSRTFGGREDDWAKYSIVLTRPVSNRQAAQIRALLEDIAPLRCELLSLDYRANPLLWNGEISFDGEYSFGAA